MAAYAQSSLEAVVTAIQGSTGFTTAQLAQSQGPFYQLLKILYGPSATSTVILNGALGATGAPNGAAE